MFCSSFLSIYVSSQAISRALQFFTEYCSIQNSNWLSSYNHLQPWINFPGLENKLSDPEELFDLPAKLRCSYVGARIDRALIGNVDEHQQYQDVPHEPFITSGKLRHWTTTLLKLGMK